MADTGHLIFHHEGMPVRATVKDCKKVVLVSTTTAATKANQPYHHCPQVSDNCVVVSVSNPLPAFLLSDVLPHGSIVSAEVDASKRRQV